MRANLLPRLWLKVHVVSGLSQGNALPVEKVLPPDLQLISACRASIILRNGFRLASFTLDLAFL